MKRSQTIFFSGLVFLLLCTPVFAEDSSTGAQIRGPVRPEIKQEVKETAAQARLSVKDRLAHITGATVTAVSPNSLVISSQGKTLSVNISSTTKLRRKFWGNATTSEIAVGDLVNVWGTWTDSSQTIINARLVRDISIQKRNGVFVGTVTSLTSLGWVMNTFNRGAQTVIVSASTKITDRNGRTITQDDVVVGNMVRVRGVWNNTTNTISETLTVKDYSIPARPASREATSSATP